MTFQSKLPARGATKVCDGQVISVLISIHAPREGSDVGSFTVKVIVILISIHAPREGSDERKLKRFLIRRKFQSTLPARGATWASLETSWWLWYFNPRSPRGERL